MRYLTVPLCRAARSSYMHNNTYKRLGRIEKFAQHTRRTSPSRPLKVLILILLIPPKRTQPLTPQPRPPPTHPPRIRIMIIPPIMLQLRRNPRPHRRAPQILPRRKPLPLLALFNLILILPLIPRMHRTSPQPMIPAIPARGRDDGSAGVP